MASDSRSAWISRMYARLSKIKLREVLFKLGVGYKFNLGETNSRQSLAVVSGVIIDDFLID